MCMNFRFITTLIEITSAITYCDKYVITPDPSPIATARSDASPTFSPTLRHFHQRSDVFTNAPTFCIQEMLRRPSERSGLSRTIFASFLHHFHAFPYGYLYPYSPPYAIYPFHIFQSAALVTCQVYIHVLSL